jgi:hypothetical protein
MESAVLLSTEMRRPYQCQEDNAKLKKPVANLSIGKGMLTAEIPPFGAVYLT